MSVLIAFASRYGATREVAKAIREEVERLGRPVRLVDLNEEAADIGAYETVFVGSGIRRDVWCRESLAFLQEHSALLKDRTLALFFCSGHAIDRPRMAAQRYGHTVAAEFGLTPSAVLAVPGVLDFSKKAGLSIFDRFLLRRVAKGKDVDRTARNDQRDWDAIKQFVDDVLG